jgi:hypothetical protein
LDFRIFSSRAIIAFLGFVAVDLTARFLCPAALLEKYDPRETTFLADLVRVWRATPQLPGVCFMGSSLMQCALKNSTPTFLNKALGAETNEPMQGSFSWALGGENASDSYMIARSMMSEQKKPKLLIYGIAPRDLFDNNVKSPVTTDIFRYLSTVASVLSLPDGAFTSIDDRVNCDLKEISFLVDRKSVFSKYTNDQMLVLIPHLVPAALTSKSAQPTQQEKIALANVQLNSSTKIDSKPTSPSRFSPDELTKSEPGNSMEKKKAAFELLQQVSKGVTIFRYNPYCPERYNRQVAFLDMLLGHLENIGVQVVVVKMPLKKEHVDIMPKELLRSYTQDVEALTRKHGAALVDFNTPEFHDNDYGDVAHLNANGAKLWQAKLVDTFKNSPYREKLASSCQSIE